MTQIETKELESHPAEVVRRVKDGETVQIMGAGRAIAMITPIVRAYSEEEGELS